MVRINEFTKENIENLKRIKGIAMKYSKLCDEINIPKKAGNAKTKQLDDLSIFCGIEIIENPTRYIIQEVYPEALLFFNKINGNDKFQLYFEAILYKAFQENGFNSIYLSNMDILKFFGEVNDNFSYVFNKELISILDEELYYFAEMGQIVYKILWQWSKRKIKAMANRYVVLASKGFRLYFKTEKVIKKFDVPRGSETEKMCMAIYNDAIEKVMPPNWAGEWVPEWRWIKFEKTVSETIEKVTKGRFFDLKSITILSPPTEEHYRKLLVEKYGGVKIGDYIREESIAKIFNTTQLARFTEEHKRKFTQYTIQLNPPLSFRQIYSKHKNSAQGD